MKTIRKCPICGIETTGLTKHWRISHSSEIDFQSFIDAYHGHLFCDNCGMPMHQDMGHPYRLKKCCCKSCEISYKNKHRLSGDPKEKAKKSTETRIQRGNLFGVKKDKKKGS